MTYLGNLFLFEMLFQISLVFHCWPVSINALAVVHKHTFVAFSFIARLNLADILVKSFIYSSLASPRLSGKTQV